MYATINGPPVIEYEKVVQPVVVSQKGTALNRHSKEDRHTRKKGTKRMKKDTEVDDLVFEPLLGMLFDYSA